jgi:hypothetical protein
MSSDSLSTPKADLYKKDPNDVLDYTQDWASVLEDGDEIIASEWIIEDSPSTPEAPLVVDSDTYDLTTARVFLSGGLEGYTYRVTNRITTADGRQKDNTIAIEVISQ